jgi:hypothetical protein
LPRFSHPSARPALEPWVAPQPRSPGRASRCGCELPRTLHLQALPAMDLRVASNFASFGAPSGEAPGFPSASVHPSRLSIRPPGCPGFRIFRPCRRWIFESPRISHPSALLALNPRVAPRLRCSSCACGCVLWVSPATASSGFAGDGSSSRPESRVLRCFRRWSFGLPLGFAFRLRLPVWCRVAPHSAPSGFALGLSFRVAPNSRSLGAG